MKIIFVFIGNRLFEEDGTVCLSVARLLTIRLRRWYMWCDSWKCSAVWIKYAL